MKLSTKQNIVYGFLIILMLIVAGGSLILNQLSDIEKLKNGLADKISKLTRFHVTIRDAELVINRGIGVSLQGVSLTRQPGSLPDLTAQEIWVDIGLFPLLAQELVIKKMLMRGSSIKVLRNPKGKIEIIGLSELFERKDELEESFFKFIKMGLVPQLVIQSGRIQFFDYYHSSDPKPILLTNLNVSIQKPMTASAFSFLFRGEIASDYGQAPFSLSGKLRNPSGGFDFKHLSVEGHISADGVELDTILPYIKYTGTLRSHPVAVSTNSDFAWSLDGQLILSGNVKYQPISKMNRPSLQSSFNSRRGKFDYKIQWANETLNIKEASFKFGESRLNVTGQIKKIDTADPKVSFVLNSSTFPVKRLQAYPPFANFPKPARLIRKTLGTGNLIIRSLSFDGALSQLKGIEESSNLALLSGEIGLRKVEWNLPFVKLHHIDGTFKLNKGKGNFRIDKAFCKAFPTGLITGTIQDIINQPRADLHVDGNLSLKEMNKFLIQEIPDSKLHGMLDQFNNFSGDGRLQLNLIGTLDNIKNLTIDGQYDFRAGGLKHKKYLRKLEDFTGSIKLNHAASKPGNNVKEKVSSWIIKFADLKGRLGKSSFNRMKGEVLVGAGKPYFKSSGQITIHATEWSDLINQGIFRPRGDFLNSVDFLDGTLIMDVSGESRSLDLNSQLNPQQLTFNNVSLKHAKLPRQIGALRGTLNISQEKISTENLQGNYGSSPFSINGQFGEDMDFKISSPKFSLKDAADFSLLQKLQMTGDAVFESRITGTRDAIEFSSRFDLTKTAYRYKDRFIKSTHSPNIFFAKGSWKAKKALTLTQLVYELGSNVIRGFGNVILKPKPIFSLRLFGNDLKPFSLGSNITPLRTSRGGAIQFDLVGEGSFNDFNQSIFQGSIDFENVEFQWDDFKYPVFVTAKAIFLEDELNVSSAVVRASDSEFRFKSKSTWREKPFVDLSISGKKVDLNDVWPGNMIFEQVRSYLTNSRLFNEGNARMAVNLGRYKFLKLDFKNVTAEISLKDRSIFIDRMDMITQNRNRIRTRGTLTLTDEGKLRVKKNMIARNIEVKDYLSKWGNTFQNGLTGKANLLQVNLEAEGVNLQEFVRTLKGKISFNLSSGKISTKKLLRGVEVLFDGKNSKRSKTESSQTVPYEKISGDFIVKKGVAKTENYLYRTPKTATSLIGTFDLNQKKMNTIIGVAPLAALDKFLTQIPVLGKIITGGDEESIVKAYYTVKGPFSSPKVESIPWTSLEKRVFGILKAILKSPSDILTAPLSNADDS